MMAALLLVFREILEASLVIGIVLAATKAIPGRGRWIAGGVAGGVSGALLLAYCASALAASLSGIGQEIFNAAVLGLAVLMLGWHVVWMARHGRALSQNFKALGQDVSAGRRTLLTLACVVGIAVLREGAEIVLFMYGIAASNATGAVPLLLGGLAGLGLGTVVGALTYWGLLKIPVRHVFAVTGVLIALLASGMAAMAVGYLQQADVLTVLSQTAWDSSVWLAQNSVLGTLLHALIGYIEQPTQAQVLAYGVTLSLVLGLTRWLRLPVRPPAHLPQTVQA
jgi:high-affinity iron transporter